MRDRLSRLQQSIDAILEVRRASLRSMLLTFAVYLAGNLLVVWILFPLGLLQAVSTATDGLVNATLVANLGILLAVVIVLRWQARLGWDDLGLRRSGWSVALVITVGVWCIGSVVQIVTAIGAGAFPFVIDPAWFGASAPRRIGVLLSQLLGNALLEELLFRAVLLRQLYRALATRLPPGPAVVLALLMSQAVFALIHLPLLYHAGLAVADLSATLLQLFMLGTLLALAYLRSGNLPLVIGIHALSNAPTSLVTERIDLAGVGWLAAGASILVILLMPIRKPITV